MGARETTPTTKPAGEPASYPPHSPKPAGRLFLAPDYRPPLAGIQLVRPRPRHTARAAGAPAGPRPRDGTTGSDEEKPQLQSPPPARRQQAGSPGQASTAS